VLCALAVGGCAGTGMTSSSAPDAVRGPSAPRFGRTVRLAPAGGQIRIALPNQARTFVRLTGPRLVAVGTRVDTRAGAVALTSAGPGQPARLQAGRFHGGIFEIRQPTALGGLVNLVIRDDVSRRQSCATRARLSQRILGLLRGNARGRFRTAGRFAAGTVRGTDWGVRDRCDGTLVLVRRGVLDVRDFRLRKDILVRAGHSYLATAP
jgi:hypothetical protein